MTNATLNKAIARMKKANAAVITELEYLFPKDMRVWVLLSCRQKRRSRATVVGHNTHHGGANVCVRLEKCKPFSRRGVRDIPSHEIFYEDESPV